MRPPHDLNQIVAGLGAIIFLKFHCMFDVHYGNTYQQEKSIYYRKFINGRGD